METLDDHLDKIRAATPADWAALLHHLSQQAYPWRRSQLVIAPTRTVPGDEWDASPEKRALTAMLERCWPSERAQNQ